MVEISYPFMLRGRALLGSLMAAKGHSSALLLLCEPPLGRGLRKIAGKVELHGQHATSEPWGELVIRTLIALATAIVLTWAVAAAHGQEDAEATQAAAIDVQQSWALLIGVNAYAEMRPLRYCTFDMKAVRDKLIDSGYPSENVFLLIDSAEELKYKPTKNNILRQLEMLTQIIKPKDRLVVAFSGHGVHLNKASYFCPADANLANPTETLVPLDSVYRMMDACGAQVKVLLVDACRVDPFRPGDKGAEDAAKAAGFRTLAVEQEVIPEGIVLLSSCKKGQQSWEDEDLHHGVFMYFVLQGLEGAADSNRDGQVGLLELYRYAESKTRARVLRAHNAAQVPSLRGEIAADPIIAMVPPRVSRKVEDSEPAAAPTSASSDSPAVRSLLKLGNNFFATGEYDKAIQAYSNAINIEPRNSLLYVKRGAAHRGRGDIKMAVIDYQSAGQPLHVNVTDVTAVLRDGDQTTATLKQGQSLSITKVERLGNLDWLWVTSVDGNDAARGWIQMSAVEPKPVAPEPAPVAAASDNSARGQNYYYDGDDREDRRDAETPAMRAAEKRLETLNNRNDRAPTPALQKQIDMQERRMDRMDRSRR